MRRRWGWPPPLVRFPKNGFLHPFHKPYRDIDGRENPRTVVELRMCKLSHSIREIPFWWEEMKDETNFEKWKEGALVRTRDDGYKRVWGLTPAMVDYVLEELRGYADLRDPETGIEVGPAERIWKSDGLIPSALREKLLAAVAHLEGVSDARDWRPGSDGLVLELVDPSLYPIVLGRTIPHDPGSPGGSKHAYSAFQWLPSDFFVFPDGKVTLASSFINNVHPLQHKDLYSVIPEILRHALPMLERVLSDMLRPLLRMRIMTSAEKLWDEEGADCIWQDLPYPSTPSENEYNGDLENALERRRPNIPDARENYDGDLEVMKDRISFRGRALQVIVKLTSVVLTPEKPLYPGEEWHVEGMRNEQIVSSFIYYYDSENVTESRLGFRRATCEPDYHDNCNEACPKVLYDMDSDSNLVQDIGDMVPKMHRCVAFTNLYQHRDQPFGLEDPTRPGHRKALVFFLVDPTQRIPSATDIAPQQREWVIDAMRGAGESSLFARLPVEVLAMIAEEVDGTMSRSEAERYREELVNERTEFRVENNQNYFEIRRD